MKAFKNKRIKIIFNSNTGWICETGPFIQVDHNFIVMINELTKKIKYVNMQCIKTIEIVGDINE